MQRTTSFALITLFDSVCAAGCLGVRLRTEDLSQDRIIEIFLEHLQLSLLSRHCLTLLGEISDLADILLYRDPNRFFVDDFSRTAVWSFLRLEDLSCVEVELGKP